MMAVDGSALFPFPDRDGDSPVMSFGVPFDGSPMVVGIDRNGKAVVAPVSVPVDGAPMSVAPDRDGDRAGYTFGTEGTNHTIGLSTPAPNGQADIVVDNWSCGPLSDDFDRANGNPLDLPDHPWYGPFPVPATAQILNNELAGLWAAGGGNAFWYGDPIITPYVMQVASVDARNIAYGGGNTWGIAVWILGTYPSGGANISSGELRVWKLADPDLKAYFTLTARRAGGTSVSGTYNVPSLAILFGNPLVVTVSDGQTKVEFLGHTETV